MSQNQELRELLQTECAWQNLQCFIYATLPNYQMGWVHRQVCAELDAFLEAVIAKKSPRLMLTMPPRHGKLCADDTPVLTPSGWVTHGELKPGDIVFHPSGKQIKVLAVGEKDKATHRVIFTNGDEIDVHLDHEWYIYARPKRGHITVETRYFVEPSKKTGCIRKLETGEEGKRGHRYIYQIDAARSLQIESRKHVLPPYVFGAWLGDGTSVAPRLNMSPDDAEIVEKEFERLGVPITGEWPHHGTGVITFSFGSGIPNRRNVFSQALKDLGVLKNKHIPEAYLFASERERLELLAGLIDTDGYFDREHGRYVFSTGSKRLADDVAELVRFCGCHCHVNENKFDKRQREIKATRTMFVVSFFPNFEIPCRLERKQNKACFGVQRQIKRIGIKRVVPLKTPKPGNCIQVDSPDGLYLVGKHLTTTHNSEIASRRFPAYALGRNPDISIIATSYSADLAARMNRDVQRIIDEPSYERIFPRTKLIGKNTRTTTDGSSLRNSDIFEVVGYKGVYRSAGVGGGITGMGADIAIIDDPFKDRMSADSATIRQNIWEWYTSTLYTRLSPGGGIILINTRWHEDDLSGRLLAGMANGEGDNWRCVNFPAIAEEDEPFRRKGEALHPERYPLEQLLKIKAAIGTRDWEALYQQHPTPEGGAVFLDGWLHRTWLPKDLPENFDSVVQSWDMTFKDGEASDFVVGQLWGRKGSDFYLLDQLRGRWSFTESVEQVRLMQIKSRRYGKRSCRVLIEDKANGPAIIDMLKHEIGGIIPIQPDGSKVARAHAVTALFEAGNVVLPDKALAPWVDEFRLELTRFPSGAHDDQVDAATQGLRYLDKRMGLHISNDIFKGMR